MDSLDLEEFPNGVKIFQYATGYRFTKDAIDLAKFCNIKKSDQVLELCSGSGVISFYAYSLNPFQKLYLNELQDNFCDLIEKNIELNQLKDKAKCIKGDLKNLNDKNFEKKLDVIICNPPYFKFNGHKINEEQSIALAKHEIAVNLKQIVEKSSSLIKDKGRFYIEIPANRLTELIGYLNDEHFETKRIKFLTNGKTSAYLAMLEAVKNGKSGVEIIIEY